MNGQPDPKDLSIDELAVRSGVLSSTVRMYQQRGLLPPPRREGRQAFYGAHHLDRLHTIQDLQGRGHSLEGIKDLIEVREQGDDIDSFFASEAIDEAMQRRFMSLKKLTETIYGPDVEPSPDLFTNAVALDLVEIVEDGAWVSPIALELGLAIRDLGIPREVLQAEFAVLLQAMTETAGRFGSLYTEWVEPGRGPEVWSELVELARKIVDFALLRALDIRRQERTDG